MRIGLFLVRSCIVACRQLKCCVIPARSVSMTQNRLLPPTGPANLLPRRIGLESMFCPPCYALITSPSCPVKKLGSGARGSACSACCLYLGCCLCIVAILLFISWRDPVGGYPMWSGCCIVVCCMTLDSFLECLVICLDSVMGLTAGRTIQMSHGKAVHTVASCTRW